MGKKERLQRRVKRIDDRFKAKVAKGKKGTDSDIQDHEDRIQALAEKGGFTAPFMAKSPLKDIPEIHVGYPNYKGPTNIGSEWAEANKKTAIEAQKKIDTGDENLIDETINSKVVLSKGAKVPRFGIIPTFTTTEYDLASQTDSQGNYIKSDDEQ